MTVALYPPCRRFGGKDKHHFFGYYNKSTWDRGNRRVLALQVPMMDARLHPELEAEVGYFDTTQGDAFHVVDTTCAWNWQMGAQLQWVDGISDSKIIYNVRSDSKDAVYAGFGSRIRDIHSGQVRELPLPIYVVAPNGKYALSVDYRRLYITHETIGYSEHGGPFDVELCPADDGIRVMDLDTGTHRMLVSYDALKQFHHRASMDKAIHWVSHIEINPASSRILFLHRWTERVEDETCFLHRLITIGPDGSDMRLLECSDHPLPQLADDFDPASVGTFDYEKSEYQISHPLWCDNERIIVWGPHAGSIHYHLYQDRDGGAVQVVGDGILTENGHMSFSPTDKQWLLSDTYPDSTTHERILFLFNVVDNRKIDLGSFYADPDLKKENRCDLHPRWNRDGTRVCIDSVHENERRMYEIDVSAIVAG